MKKKISILLASTSDGGVGKTRILLANEFIRQGCQVDLVLGKQEGQYMEMLDPAVRVVILGTSHALFGVPRLAWYFRKERPDVVLTQRIRVNVLALRARQLAGVNVPIFVTINTLVAKQMEVFDPGKGVKQLRMLRRYYPQNDGIIAVSRGVAEEASNVLGLPAEKIEVIHDPVVTQAMEERAREPVDHPWLRPGQPPVILGMGRLDPVKDFSSLLRAFAKLRAEMDCRLILLGKGKLRDELIGLAAELGIKDQCDLPGFVENPYAWLSKAALFVLSSRFEGFSLALAEALALGIPAVATDCPCGPREILDEGRYGPLVPVGDVDALAQAMLTTLRRPPAGDFLRTRGAAFRADVIAKQYLRAFGVAHVGTMVVPGRAMPSVPVDAAS